MNEAQEFFQELMFGSGAWLGLILILGLMILITYKVKEAGFAFLLISIFLGIEYFNNVSASSNFFWSGIIMFLFGAMLAVSSVVRYKQ